MSDAMEQARVLDEMATDLAELQTAWPHEHPNYLASIEALRAGAEALRLIAEIRAKIPTGVLTDAETDAGVASDEGAGGAQGT